MKETKIEKMLNKLQNLLIELTMFKGKAEIIIEECKQELTELESESRVSK